MSGRNFHLVTLGRLTLLRPDGSEERSLSTRRRKLALLSVLALAARPVERDTLVEMFWGTHDEPRARHSLSDTLSHLRRVLGPDAIASRGTEISLDDRLPLVTDAREVARAAAAGDAGRVLALYTGEFFGGVRIDADASFAHWLDAERARLRLAFERASAREFERLTRADQWEEAAAVAARWAEAAPLAPDAIIAVLTALAAPDTPDALRAACARYDEHAALLRRELDVEPDPLVRRAAERITARLNRIVAPPVRAVAAVPPTNDPTTRPAPPIARPRRWKPPVWLAAAGAGAVGALLGIGWLVESAGARARPVHADVVAVVPFRVAGADSSLAYLREGLMDLLDAKLTGEVGPRSVDPRTVMSAWRRAGGSRSTDLALGDAASLARRLDAGQLLLGAVVGRPEHLSLEASIVSTAEGRVVARAVVDGSSDSLAVLVDRLAARLLAAEAGEREDHLGRLAGTSLAALRPYLRGRVAYRAGRLDDAKREFRDAFEVDSEFALAALGLAASGGWTTASESEQIRRGVHRALRLRSRLGERERAFFDAYIGPRFPEVPSAARETSDWARAVQLAPDSPEAWYELGDRYFHVGTALGLVDARDRATRAFSRALELDSTFSLPLGHLLELAAERRDSAAVRHLAALFVARDSTSATAGYLRWRTALALDDTATASAIRAHWPAVGASSLERVVGMSQVDALGTADGAAAANALAPLATTPLARFLTAMARHQLALNRGRPAEALQSLADIRALEPLPNGFVYSVLRADHLAIADALFGGGDDASAVTAARAMRARTAAGDATDPAARAMRQGDQCALALWDLAHGDAAGARPLLRRLRAVPAADSSQLSGGNPVLCVAMLDAMLAVDQHSAAARPAVARLDSLLATWPAVFGVEFGNLVVARLWEQLGETNRALGALRRRPNYWTLGPRYLAAFLREEGRLDAATGDTAAAAGAYRHLLALELDPEPAWLGQLARDRVALAAVAGPAPRR